MKTRLVGLIYTVAVGLLGVGTSMITVVPRYVTLFMPVAWLVGVYLLYVSDERVTPVNTFSDWIRGSFYDVDDLEEDRLKRRYNIFRYKYDQGPFKIRYLFKLRFGKKKLKKTREEIEEELDEEDIPRPNY